MLKENLNSIYAPCENVSPLYGLDNKPFSRGVLILLIMAIGHKSGIYQIVSKIKPNKVYIGSSNHLGHRFATHKTQLSHNTHRNAKLQRHANKYGIDDFVFSIIEECPVSSLIEREQFYLDTLIPWFNLSPSADSCRGCKRTEESKKRYSDAVRGRIASRETREKQSKAKKGVTPWNLGISHSKDAIINISKSVKKFGKFEYLYGILIKYVYQYDPSMNVVNKFKTIKEAVSTLSLSRKMISVRCNQKPYLLYRGYYFRYVLEIDKDSCDYFSVARKRRRNRRSIMVSRRRPKL